jgi:hypothetical protein
MMCLRSRSAAAGDGADWHEHTACLSFPFLSWHHSLTLHSFLLCLCVFIYGDGSLSLCASNLLTWSPVTLINLHQHNTSPTTPKHNQNKQHRANKHNKVPETKNIEEGSSRRNITRRHNTHYDSNHKKVKKQGGGSGVGGKGQWNELDDGSLL